MAVFTFVTRFFPFIENRLLLFTTMAEIRCGEYLNYYKVAPRFWPYRLFAYRRISPLESYVKFSPTTKHATRLS